MFWFHSFDFPGTNSDKTIPNLHVNINRPFSDNKLFEPILSISKLVWGSFHIDSLDSQNMEGRKNSGQSIQHFDAIIPLCISLRMVDYGPSRSFTWEQRWSRFRQRCSGVGSNKPQSSLSSFYPRNMEKCIKLRNNFGYGSWGEGTRISTHGNGVPICSTCYLIGSRFWGGT